MQTIEHITTNQTIIDQGQDQDRVYHIGAGVTLSYLFLPEQDGDYVRQFHVETGGILEAASIILPHRTTLQFDTFIEGDTVTSLVRILALAQNGSNLSIQGTSHVEKPYRQVNTRVDQTNVLIGTEVQIRGTPILRIATDDIQGGHSCKVHRLGGETLFYLQSRGLDTKNAESLLLSGEIRKHLSIIDDEQKKESLYEEILERLK